MIDKLARVDTYKGYMYFIKHIYQDKEYDIEVHGGITFSGYLSRIMDLENMDLEEGYVLGFDCNHVGDNPKDCNQEYVESECKKLIDQLINLDNCKVNNKNKEVDVIRNIDDKTRLVVKHVLSGKAFWVIEENHEGKWIEVLKICENQADVDSVVNFYLENKRRSLYE